MFALHAVYGLGATVAPFVATAFVQQVTERFYNYYCISLGLAFITVVTLILAFQGRNEDQIVGKREAEVPVPPVPVPDPGAVLEGESAVGAARREKAQRHQDDVVTGPGEPGLQPESGGKEAEVRASSQKLRAILVSPKSYFLAFYIFLYVSI